MNSLESTIGNTPLAKIQRMNNSNYGEIYLNDSKEPHSNGKLCHGMICLREGKKTSFEPVHYSSVM